MLYTLDFPQTLVFARIVRRNLAKIGLDVQVKGLPQSAFFSRAFARAEPVDIVFTPWTPDYIDPFSYLNAFFDSRFIGSSNNARLDSPVYDRLLRERPASRVRLELAPTDRSMYGSLETPLRSWRPRFSTSRRSCPSASAASCFVRSSTSRPSA